MSVNNVEKLYNVEKHRPASCSLDDTAGHARHVEWQRLFLIDRQQGQYGQEACVTASVTTFTQGVTKPIWASHPHTATHITQASHNGDGWTHHSPHHNQSPPPSPIWQHSHTSPASRLTNVLQGCMLTLSQQSRLGPLGGIKQEHTHTLSMPTAW